MKIELWDIDRPRDYPKNARKWSPQSIATVAASIKEFGFVQPVVVDKHDVIIIGLTGKQATLEGHGATFEHVRDGRRLEAADAIGEEVLERLSVQS